MSSPASRTISESPDDQQFEEMYRGIPLGLTVAAAKLDHLETLRSFCYSLKGAAIRLGSNAMFFLCGYSKRQWLTKGIEHFRSFVEKHQANGVRLFLIDQPTGWADKEVSGLIREFAETAGVSVIVTAIADPKEEGDEKRLAVLEEGKTIVFSGTRSAIALRGRSTTRIAGGEPFHLRAPDGRRLLLRVTHQYSELERDFYSAITCFGGLVEEYGPLYFLEKCPQPPGSEGWPPPIPRAEV
jgi:hypothetical protein